MFLRRAKKGGGSTNPVAQITKLTSTVFTVTCMSPLSAALHQNTCTKCFNIFNELPLVQVNTYNVDASCRN